MTVQGDGAGEPQVSALYTTRIPASFPSASARRPSVLCPNEVVRPGDDRASPRLLTRRACPQPLFAGRKGPLGHSRARGFPVCEPCCRTCKGAVRQGAATEVMAEAWISSRRQSKDV
jgi:hypothetical protein